MNRNLRELVMENEYIPLPTKGVGKLEVEDLQILRAKNFAKAVDISEYCTLISCEQIEVGDDLLLKAGDEIITIDIRPEVSQRPQVDIRYTERLSIVFDNLDKDIPAVFALRKSFPNVLHRLSMYFVEPVALCIYEESFHELKLKWRSSKFLYDIKTWLELTAIDKLHQIDQPLEPLLLRSSGTLILPVGLQKNEKVSVELRSKRNGQYNFILKRGQSAQNNFIFSFISGQVQDHGIMDKAPRTIKDLNDFLLRSEVDFYTFLKNLIREEIDHNDTLNCRLILLVQLPKKGNNSRVENDFYAFLTHEDMRSIGVQLNLWKDGPEGLGFVFPIIPPDEAALSLSKVEILTPFIQLNPAGSEFFSGHTCSDQQQLQIAQIGVGALGSQIFSNFRKTGFGRWNLIDKDILLPHNTVRHELHPKFTGLSKSLTLADEANDAFNSNDFASAIWDDYLQPEEEKKLNEILNNASIIIDTSASVAVARKLVTDDQFKARRISVFLSPSGRDLILLGEDSERYVTLDTLEFQYYQLLIQDENLKNHLFSDAPVRYSNSCRDITSRISQEFVAMHAAISCTAIRQFAIQKEVMARICRIDETQMGITVVNVPIYAMQSVEINDWKIFISEHLLQIVSNERSRKLPNETGGILIGGIDFLNRKIYLVHTILSPDDSEETPVSYVRGINGVKEKLNSIEKITSGNLTYIGEWHSHPLGCALNMSDDDHVLFTEISNNMENIGFPGLMLIVGDNSNFKIYLSD